jgi:hypothetical protein
MVKMFRTFTWTESSTDRALEENITLERALLNLLSQRPATATVGLRDSRFEKTPTTAAPKNGGVSW